jgi:hypothetical protein
MIGVLAFVMPAGRNRIGFAGRRSFRDAGFAQRPLRAGDDAPGAGELLAQRTIAVPTSLLLLILAMLATVAALLHMLAR